ncbi:MAG: hypothetical protein LBQ33_01905 [Oscillospiraceae bacterium]|jgi:hypothetical protein|nr:hypothetical protein [Oscillospiraceae bacterium]
MGESNGLIGGTLDDRRKKPEKLAIVHMKRLICLPWRYFFDLCLFGTCIFVLFGCSPQSNALSEQTAQKSETKSHQKVPTFDDFSSTVPSLSTDSAVETTILSLPYVSDPSIPHPSQGLTSRVPSAAPLSFPIKTVTFMKLRPAYDGFDIVKMLQTPSEIQVFQNYLKPEAWELAEEGHWLKYNPARPNGQVIFVQGVEDQLAVMHLYTDPASKSDFEGGVSLALFDRLSLAPSDYQPFTNPLVGFKRYYVSSTVYHNLLALFT